MKIQNIRPFVKLALVAALATAASPASAAGLLGQRYVGGTVDYVIWDNDVALDNALGFSLTYNQPLTTNLDLSLNYSWLNSDISGTSSDITGQAFSFGGAWYTPVSSSAKFYAGAQLGWQDTDFSDSDSFYALEAGVEFTVNPSFTVTPFVAYSDGFDSGTDGVFNFGALGEFDLGNNWSWLISASIDDDSNTQLSTGAVLRF